MLCTIFIDAWLAEYQVEAQNLTSCDSIGRDDIIKVARERHHRISRNRNFWKQEERNQALVTQAMLCTPAVTAVVAVVGKVETVPNK